tara:strand:+ start:182 stop:382 length:201 start_codon:yes stop_codon:yes gene_type:complete
MILFLLNYRLIFVMYYLAKFFELIGISVIPIAFFFNWPDPMSEFTLLYAVIFFLSGWIIEKYFLKG